ncbi:hypothetical protein niasHS_002791 [Heterodera schachtii]|uniref:Uncharacterized protein n=1 Tax=Heterodera schachtii TaxID=97005 RepID=A0ABD2K2V2_HETSC
MFVESAEPSCFTGRAGAFEENLPHNRYILVGLWKENIWEEWRGMRRNGGGIYGKEVARSNEWLVGAFRNGAGMEGGHGWHGMGGPAGRGLLASSPQLRPTPLQTKNKKRGRMELKRTSQGREQRTESRAQLPPRDDWDGRLLRRRMAQNRRRKGRANERRKRPGGRKA